jgi:hypothetical protein
MLQFTRRQEAVPPGPPPKPTPPASKPFMKTPSPRLFRAGDSVSFRIDAAMAARILEHTQGMPITTNDLLYKLLKI